MERREKGIEENELHRNRGREGGRRRVLEKKKELDEEQGERRGSATKETCKE